MKRFAILLFAVFLPAYHPGPHTTIDYAAIEKMAADQDSATKALTASSANYAWDLFLMLNKPVVGTDPKTWEHWKPTSEVYLKDGGTPSAWDPANQPGAPPPEVLTKAREMGLNTSLPFHNLDSTIQVDGLVLKDSKGVVIRYQLLMNQYALDYIIARGIYNINGQEALAASGKVADFPWNAYELKTSWIWLGGDETRYQELKDKYYVVNSYYEAEDRDGNPAGYVVGRAAMTGMHVINKNLPEWVWMTFENIYNPTTTQAKLELPIDDSTARANTTYQERLKSMGSVFANYQLDGVQTTFYEKDDPQKATLLANSQIESAFQPQSSCITCHALASVNKSGAHFNFTNTQGGDVSYYTGSPGNPPMYEKDGYIKLDYVWSLKRAFRKR